MKRTQPYMLNVSRQGQTMPAKLFFTTEEDMLKHVTSTLKKSFVGRIQGFVWEDDNSPEGGTWTVLQKVEDMQSTDNTAERTQIFVQAASLLKVFSRVSGPLDRMQQSELADILNQLRNVQDTERRRKQATTPAASDSDFTLTDQDYVDGVEGFPVRS